jgi:hypothetical protein
LDDLRRLYSCFDADVSDIYRSPSGRGAVAIFEGPYAQSVMSKVVLDSSPAQAAMTVDILSRDNAANCWEHIVGTQDVAAITAGRPTASRRTIHAHGVDAVEYRVTLPVSQGKYHTNSYQDFIFAVKGRAFVMLTALDTEEPVPDDMSEAFLNDMLDRLP